MVITVIDEVKNSDASTDVNDSIEDVTDFLVTASATAAANSLDLSSAEIADREIKIWKTRTVPFLKDKNPLDEWRHDAVRLFPWLGVLARRVFATATSAAPERLFYPAGDMMTKKRSRLTCDNIQELVYRHEFCRRCGSGRRSRRCARRDFFWIHETHYLQCLLLSLVLWLWDSIWVTVPLLSPAVSGDGASSSPRLSLFLFPSLYIYIYIYIKILFWIFFVNTAPCFSSPFFSLHTYTYTYTHC